MDLLNKENIIMTTLLLSSDVCDYDTRSSNEKFDEYGYCRSSTLSVDINRIDRQYLVKDILKRSGTWLRETGIINFHSQIQQDHYSTEVKVLLDTMLELGGLLSTDNFEPCIVSGYYGEELEGFNLDIDYEVTKDVTTIMSIYGDKGFVAALEAMFNLLHFHKEYEIKPVSSLSKLPIPTTFFSKSKKVYNSKGLYPLGIVALTSNDVPNFLTNESGIRDAIRLSSDDSVVVLHIV